MYIIYTETKFEVKHMLAEVVTIDDINSLKLRAPKTDYKYQQKAEVKCEKVDPLKSTKSIKSNPRYKTEKCRQFYEWGRCDYGSRCMFAHGTHELNIEGSSRRPHYKTRICTTFEFQGYCTFGSRCAFVHKMPDPIELINSVISAIPRLPMPENTTCRARPEFYPSDILVRKPNREMVRDLELLPSDFSQDMSIRLSTFTKLTDSNK